ncbi:hypothetical protein ACGFYV_37480, partial [Streptomyces sp. NPDC048297]|uniref:hypothetical protein n=1 Tax=Streptomyces sp. NPDC048297 TaxID=3365531 RepID=UPI00371BD658
MRIRQHPLVKLAYPDPRDLVRKLASNVEFTRALADHLDAFRMPHEIRRLLEDPSDDLRRALTTPDFPGGELLRLALRDPYTRSQVRVPASLKALGNLVERPEFAQALFDNPGIVLTSANTATLARLSRASGIPGFWSAARKDALLLSTMHRDYDLVGSAHRSPTAFAEYMANDGALLRLVHRFRNVSTSMTYSIVQETDLTLYGVVFHRLADAARDAQADPDAVPKGQWGMLLGMRTILQALAEDAQAPLVKALGAHPKILAAALQRSAFEQALTTEPERFLPHVNDPDALLAEIEALGPIRYTDEGLMVSQTERVLFSSLSLPLDEARARISSVESDAAKIEDRLQLIEEIHEASEDLPDLRAVLSDDRNVGLQAAVVNNAALVAAMRERPALLPKLIASGKARAVVANDPEFTLALVENGKLLHAFLNDTFFLNMAVARSDFRRNVSRNREMWRYASTPTAPGLISATPGLMSVLVASEPFAGAFFTRPGIQTLLEDGGEFVDHLVAIVGRDQNKFTPERVEVLNRVTRAILSVGDESFSAVVFQPEIVDTLVNLPRFAGALAAQSGVILSEDEFLTLVDDAVLPDLFEAHPDAAALILSNRTLFVATLHNPNVVRAVQNVDGLRELLEHNDDVARLLGENPGFVATITAHPDVVPTLRGRPRLVQALRADRALMSDLEGDNRLWALLRSQRSLVQDATTRSDLWRLVLAKPGLVDALLAHPGLLSQIRKRTGLNTALLQSRAVVSADQVRGLYGNKALAGAVESRP